MTRELDYDEQRVRCEELEKEIDRMRAVNQPATATLELPQMGHVKMAINAKLQITGEVKVYNKDISHAYAEAYQIIKIIGTKNVDNGGREY